MSRDTAATTSLAPGFRFHPTDQELISYYLKRKVTNKPSRFDPIAYTDIYKSEPWDLPGKSKLKTRDLEWYFFSMLDKKYGNGSRTNRATEKGYWKTTGKDRPIIYNSRTVGMKKTLVYHLGRAPRGERSNWVMHEYRLDDEQLNKAGIAQDSYVLCRVFQKSGTGPKNGEQYGAPFIEEEWEEEEEDDEVALVPDEEEEAKVTVAVANGDCVYIDANDFDQNLDINIPSDNAPLPYNFYYGDTSNHVEQSVDHSEADQKPVIGMGETQCGSELPDDRLFFDIPEEYEINASAIKDEYVAESSNNENPVDFSYLLDEPYLDATDNTQYLDATDNTQYLNATDNAQYLDVTDNAQYNDGLYLETNDLSNSAEADPTNFDLGDYLAYFDTDGEQSMDSQMMSGENYVSDQAPLTEKLVNGGTEQVSMASQHMLEAHGNNDASSSRQNPELEPTKFVSDEYPFIKQASHMLGGIPAPPAFASEFPTKDAILRLNSEASSSSVHVTAGMIKIRSTTLNGSGMEWSYGKNGDLNIVLSFNLSQDVGSASLVPMGSLLSGKAATVVSRGWYSLMFLSVLILSVSFKMASYIYTR